MPVLNQMSLILQLLCGYYNLFPEVCRQHSIDFSSLLDGISKARKQSSDEPTDNDNLLYLYTLQLLSVSNIQLEDLLQEVRWFWYMVTMDSHNRRQWKWELLKQFVYLTWWISIGWKHSFKIWNLNIDLFWAPAQWMTTHLMTIVFVVLIV